MPKLWILSCLVLLLSLAPELVGQKRVEVGPRTYIVAEQRVNVRTYRYAQYPRAK